MLAEFDTKKLQVLKEQMGKVRWQEDLVWQNCSEVSQMSDAHQNKGEKRENSLNKSTVFAFRAPKGYYFNCNWTAKQSCSGIPHITLLTWNLFFESVIICRMLLSNSSHHDLLVTPDGTRPIPQMFITLQNTGPSPRSVWYFKSLDLDFIHTGVLKNLDFLN